MEQLELEVTKREVLGKKVKLLRRQGITPVHLFGHGIESLALQCDAARLKRVLAQAGQTRLINLKIDNEKPRTVIVRGVQKEPLSGESLHTDFYQVEMAERVKMEVPIVLTGEAPALKLKENRLIKELDTLSIECLPAIIPNSIEVDVNSLTESDQAIRVMNITLDKVITVHNDPDQVVVRIISRPTEKLEEEAAHEGEAETPEGEKSREG